MNRGRVGKIGVVLFFTAFCLLFLSSADITHAYGMSLVINEISPAPLGDEKEWVEIYNPTDEDIDLSRYALKDGGVSAKSLDGVVEAGGYYVYENVPGWLNNDGEVLFLLDTISGQIIDKVAYGDWEVPVLPENDDSTADDNAIQPPSGRSISRIPNGYDSNVDRDDFRLVLPSPGEENIIPSYPDTVRVNEILPRPAEGSEAEFVELYNASDREVDLSDWSLDDMEGGSSPYLIPAGTTIPPLGFLVLRRTETSLSLNDDGDDVRLIDPNGEVKSIASYLAAKRGLSYSYAGDWYWSITATPSAINIIKLEVVHEEEEVLLPGNITEAKMQPVGIEMIVTGVVTVAPGILSSQYFYIEDATGGIQVYSHLGQFPDLKPGDRISVRGELSSYYGEARLKTSISSDIIIIESREAPMPREIGLDEISEEDVGTYVQTTGTVDSSSGSTFVISGSPKLKVLVRDSAQVNKPRLKKGQRVLVSGIVSSYNGTLRLRVK